MCNIKSLPTRGPKTIREENRDFAQPGAVNPEEVTKDTEILFTEDETAELSFGGVASGWRWWNQ